MQLVSIKIIKIPCAVCYNGAMNLSIIAPTLNMALGELGKARLMRDRAEELLSGAGRGEMAVLLVNPRLMSQAVGQHGANREWLKGKFALKELKFRPDAGVETIKLGE